MYSLRSHANCSGILSDSEHHVTTKILNGLETLLSVIRANNSPRRHTIQGPAMYRILPQSPGSEQLQVSLVCPLIDFGACSSRTSQFLQEAGAVLLVDVSKGAVSADEYLHGLPQQHNSGRISCMAEDVGEWRRLCSLHPSIQGVTWLKGGVALGRRLPPTCEDDFEL
ncbi:hypothetical protein GY45DRAFT_1321954 [Cubamyces sp. BRFM 1775]|nr:hypothetical protein GY45DRAFT_1321954 [Cubamyces sp. BRFM 1775]